MADLKISQLTGATTPLAGTEVLPIVQSSSTKKVAVSDLTAGRAVSGSSYAVTGATAPANGMYLYAANSLGLATNSTLSAVVDSSQNWRIKHTYAPSTTTALSVEGVYNSGAPATNSNVAIRASGGGAVSIWLSASAYSYGWIQAIQDDGSNNIKPLYLSPLGGDVRTGANIIPQVAGQGVNFTANTPAAGMTSQLLNWYEEGTWTPVYTPSSGAFGTIGAVTSGRYRRVGSTVFLWADIRTTGTPDLGTASGQLYITGLPFTPSALGGCGQVSIMQKWNLGTALTSLGVVVDVSNARLYFAKNSSNSGVSYVQATELSTATDNFGNLMGFFAMYTV